jgi:hypothetical protein
MASRKTRRVSRLWWPTNNRYHSLHARVRHVEHVNSDPPTNPHLFFLIPISSFYSSTPTHYYEFRAILPPQPPWKGNEMRVENGFHGHIINVGTLYWSQPPASLASCLFSWTREHFSNVIQGVEQSCKGVSSGEREGLAGGAKNCKDI